jgi:very-short-patch-repair endonuclease
MRYRVATARPVRDRTRVNPRLRELLDTHDGVFDWQDCGLPRHVVEYAARARQITTPYPGIVVDPDRLGEPGWRRRAALLAAGPTAALSHLSALAAWGLPVDDGPAIHVMTGPERRIRLDGVVAHRRPRFEVIIRAGLRVTRLEDSLVDSWPLAEADRQRAPLLHAVNARPTTPRRLATVAAQRANLTGRRTLIQLIGRLDAGCRSELELWGYERIFRGPGMPEFHWQVPVRLGTGLVYLDVVHRPTMANFELDGAKWHGSPQSRERDLRRDAALAARGYRVVRLTHERLTRHPAEVRAEILAILASARARA